MVNLLAKFLGRSGVQTDPHTRTSVYTEAVRSEGFEPNETEIALRKQLATFLEAIHDEGVEALLFDKVMPRVFVPALDESGGVVYQTQEVLDDRGRVVPLFDAEGKAVKDEGGNVVPQRVALLNANGDPIPKFVEGRQVNDYYAALNNYLSHINRLSFIQPAMVQLHALYADDIISDILLNTPRSKINSGEIAYMKSVYNQILIALQDAVNGKKITALLTLRKENAQDVNLRSDAAPKKGFF